MYRRFIPISDNLWQQQFMGKVEIYIGVDNKNNNYRIADSLENVGNLFPFPSAHFPQSIWKMGHIKDGGRKGGGGGADIAKTTPY